MKNAISNIFFSLPSFAESYINTFLKRYGTIMLLIFEYFQTGIALSLFLDFCQITYLYS